MCSHAIQEVGAVTGWQQVNVKKKKKITQLILGQGSGRVNTSNTLTGPTVQAFIPVCSYGYNSHLQKWEYTVKKFTQIPAFCMPIKKKINK